MDAGEFKERITVLELSKTPEGFQWETARELHGKAEPLNKQNIFSRMGLGAKTMVFTTRKCTLTLHNYLIWRQKHYFITDVNEIGREYYEITTAAIDPVVCILERVETVKDELKRPIAQAPVALRFPACLTEKFLGYEQGKPMAITEVTYVLVTPKPVKLSAGDLVRVNLPHFEEPQSYVVQKCHVLDEYKNEYEIMRRADV